MHSPDRYALALAMLDGDREARKILADLLEEQGERGLAQWAREGRRDKRRTLEFAVVLLPCRLAIGLVSDFILHAFAEQHEAALLDPLAYLLFRWSAGSLGQAEAVAEGRQMVRAVPSTWPVRSRRQASALGLETLRSALSPLVEAIDYTGRAEASESGPPTGGTPRHWQSTAMQHLRAAIVVCQNRAKPIVHRRTPNLEAQRELDWQLQQTKAFYTRLLTEETPWPK